MSDEQKLLKRIQESIRLNWDNVPEELHAFTVNIENACSKNEN